MNTLDRRETTWWPTVGQKVAKVGRKSAQKTQSGIQVGAKNGPKSGPERQKRFPRWRPIPFSSIFRAISVRSHIPDRFWKGQNLESHAPTTAGARFSENHRFQKNIENIVSRDLFCNPKSTKIDAERTENHQNCQKTTVFAAPENHAFFLHAKKT